MQIENILVPNIYLRVIFDLQNNKHKIVKIYGKITYKNIFSYIFSHIYCLLINVNS